MTSPLGLAIWLIVLSVLVQVVQQLWKYLTSSEARAFESALADFLGPSVQRVLRNDPRVSVRGPLQRHGIRRAGYVLPTDRDALLVALETAAPAWHVTVLRVLEEQKKASGDKDAFPTACLDDVLYALERAARKPSAPGNPAQVAEFLGRIGVRASQPVNGARAVEEFRRRFFPHLTPLVEHYPQFMRNFEYAHRRSSYRQLFVTACVVGWMVNVPLMFGTGAVSVSGGFDTVEAARMPTHFAEPAVGVACPENAVIRTPPARPCEAPRVHEAAAWNLLFTRPDDPAIIRVTRYLLVSAITALLLTFGASLWNDIILALTRASRPPWRA